MKKHLAERWPWYLSFLVLLSAGWIFMNSAGVKDAALYGDFFSGIAGALAFIWLIAGFMQQSRELHLQREELTAQRQELAAQKEQLALGQVATMLSTFTSYLQSRNLEGVSSPNDIPSFYMGRTAVWNSVLEPRTEDEQASAFLQWTAAENTAAEFLSTAASAARFYVQATNDEPIHEAVDDGQFVQLNFERIRVIPHLQLYIDKARVLAEDMSRLEPGRDRVRLAGFEGLNKRSPGLVREDKLADLRRRVEARNRQDP